MQLHADYQLWFGHPPPFHYTCIILPISQLSSTLLHTAQFFHHFPAVAFCFFRLFLHCAVVGVGSGLKNQ